MGECPGPLAKASGLPVTGGMSVTAPGAKAGARVTRGGAGAGGRGVARRMAGREPARVPAPPSPSRGTAVARGWPVGDYLAFAPHPPAIQCARLHAHQIAWEWGLDHLCESLDHVLGELMANAVTASATVPGTCPVGVWLLTDHRALLVLVWDPSPRPPQPTTPDPYAEHGRGLVLVEHFSEQWNWYRTPGTGGKVVWALITAPGETGEPPWL
jgi:anti-sigma regulatory factor (Ser/Thr protein kinase)